MHPAKAKTMDSTAVEEVGHATLQIVHDLKNQLNGLKLYATFLRKRLEPENKSSEEQEIVGKLITGLDNAAREMSALVRFARPLELRQIPQTDLRKVIMSVTEVPNRNSGGLELPSIALHIEDAAMFGDFDGSLLVEAFNAITAEVRHSVPTKSGNTISLHVHRETDQALCEWRGGKLKSRYQAINNANGCGTIHTALAAKIIEAHGGCVQCDEHEIRAWLPLTNPHKFIES
jgi:light-regulated signal transduction histidine kinase (bacteriophytochrome)